MFMRKDPNRHPTIHLAQAQLIGRGARRAAVANTEDVIAAREKTLPQCDFGIQHSLENEQYKIL